MQRRTIVLIVLDGWGIGHEDDSNPIHEARPEHFAWIASTYPTTSLQASGISVGLPWGEVGNSEVGHLTLGAGKVLYQHYPRIMLAIQNKNFFRNPALQGAFAHARTHNSSVHLIGLLTKANVHASLEHLQALLAMADQEGRRDVKLHLFADGKDSPPQSFQKLLEHIPRNIVATVTGRFYAMDRDQSWQFTKRTYDNMTAPHAPLTSNLEAALETTFARDGSEEYLPPLRLREDAAIQDNDSLIFFNFREDGIRQISEACILPHFTAFPTLHFKNLSVVTMTEYEKDFAVPVAFPADTILHPLGRVLSDAGQTQLRLAETYKYAHVTYFFNGMRESPYKNELRALIPSLQTPHPDKNPKLRASLITDRLLSAITDRAFDFILVNYANADTIGHTGNYEAGIEAIDALNTELGRILKVALGPHTVLVITADHGNIEKMRDMLTWRTQSQHDPSPVPLYLVGEEFRGRKFLNAERLAFETNGGLADVAPTILELMGISKPPEMTGRSLLQDLL